MNPSIESVRRRTPSLLPNYVVLIILVLFALAPIVVLVFNSLKADTEVGVNPLGPPQQPLPDNYPTAWDVGNFEVTVRNSIILVAGTIAILLPIAGLAAYALARLNPRGAGLMLLYLLTVSSLPIQLFLVPLFFAWRALGLVDNLLGPVIIYVALQAPFAIFLLRSFMLQIPRDFDDAARVDGAGNWGVFRYVIAPLTLPGFLTVGLIVGLFVWNEFLISTIFLTSGDVQTVVTSYFRFTSRFSRDWGLTSAAAMMMILPIIGLFFVFQRRFVEGLSSAGLKG